MKTLVSTRELHRYDNIMVREMSGTLMISHRMSKNLRIGAVAVALNLGFTSVRSHPGAISPMGVRKYN